MMDSRKILKRIRYAVLEVLFKACLWVASFASCAQLRGLSRFLIVNFLYRMNIRMVKNGRRTVGLAYGEEKTEQQKEALLKASFEHLADVVGEVIYYFKNWQAAEAAVRMSGREHLDRALAGGKGVVAVTAHFGNFPLMVFWMARKGYKVNVIMRRPREPKVSAHVLQCADQAGIHLFYTIPNRACVQEAIKGLRRGEILFILLDQNYGADARVHVDFFGRDSTTGASPAIFAHRTGAAVVPMFCVRQEDNTHCIHIEPPVEMGTGKDLGEDPAPAIQKIIAVIERYIRTYPRLWSWMHNRWKEVVAE